MNEVLEMHIHSFSPRPPQKNKKRMPDRRLLPYLFATALVAQTTAFYLIIIILRELCG